MKRLIALLVVLLGALPAFGASYWTLNLDDQPLPAEMPPIAVGQNTLLVSARSLCQALRATYDQDAASGRIRISRSGTVVELQEGVAQARVNGREVRMPVAAKRESGLMMLPVPFIAEVLGYRASVDASAMVMTLSSSGAGATFAAAPDAGGEAPPPSLTGAPPSQSALPSALPWLANGQLPTATPLQAPTALPPVSAAVPAMTATPAMTASAQMTSMPSVETGQRMTTGGSAGYVQLPGDVYQASYRVDPGTRARTEALATFSTPYDYREDVTTTGSMDYVPVEKALEVNGEVETPSPDPAVSGLTLERRYDQFVTAYTVRYRITNIGTLPTDRPLMLRLLIGGRGALQIMQDIKIERLDSMQSLSFEWSGDARSYPALHDMVVRAQAKVMLDDSAIDRNTSNNVRSVRMRY